MRSLARLQDVLDIQRRLRTLQPASRRRWGRMSAQQMVCHLCDSFRMLLGDKPVSHSSSLLQRTVVKWAALYLPLPWPAGIRTRPEVDQEQGGTRPAAFAGDVASLLELLEAVTTSPRRFDGERHPTLGRMSHREWLRWGYLHVDHHLRQFGS